VVPHNRPTIEEPDIAAVSQVLATGRIGQGLEVRAFEEETAARFGRPGWDGVAVSSGTAALYLALRAAGVGAGDRVLIPTYVCTALAHATTLAGAEAWLADIRDTDFNLDVSRLSLPPRLKAVVLPHIYGVPSDPGPLRRLGVTVIDDGAQAIGGRWRGQPVGSLGDMSIFSFYATKPLTCGQGGMVLGPSEACDAIRDYRDYDGKRELRPRFNFQMSDMQAALGRSQLRRLDAFLARRRETAALYASALPPTLGRQQSAPGAEPNHHRFVIRLGRVAEAGKRFEASGITTIVPTEPWELLHRQMGLPEQAFPVAEAVAKTTLSVPIQPSLSEDERRRIASVIGTLGDLA
jgi:dTDP-4-amino-4,6-dideoxygalactose transaminase